MPPRAHAPVVVLLLEEKRDRIGRHNAADVVFEESAVSRVHGVRRASSAATAAR